MKQNRTRQTGEAGFPWIEASMAVGKGLGVAIVLLLILLFLSSIALYHGVFSQENMTGMVLVCTLFSALAGGGFALSLLKKHGLFLGMAVGILLFLVLLLLGYCFYGKTTLGTDSLEILFASFCGGCLAKLFTKKRKKY